MLPARGQPYDFAHTSDYVVEGESGRGAYAIVVKASCRTAAAARRCGITFTDDAMQSPQGTDGTFPQASFDHDAQAPADTAGDEDAMVLQTTHVAIKQLLDIQSTTRTSVTEEFALVYLRKVVREIDMLKHFRPGNEIINVGDVYLSPDGRDAYIVMPYFEHNLREVVSVCHGPVAEPLAKWILCQVLMGLNSLHKAGAMHRDLTPSNVMVDTVSESWDARICDLGLARAAETALKDLTLDVVTLPYRAPELLLQMPKYTDKVDIWALGCIAMEVLRGVGFLHVENCNPDPYRQLLLMFRTLTGFPMSDSVRAYSSAKGHEWIKKNEAQMGPLLPPKDVASLFGAPVTADEVAAHGVESSPTDADGKRRVTPECIDFLRRALVLDPAERASAEELLRCPWFADDEQCGATVQYHLEEVATAVPRYANDVERLETKADLMAKLRELSGGCVADIKSTVTPLAE